MRVKQTAKKITNEVVNADDSNEKENSEHNSCDNANDVSDNEVEFVVECRRDNDGNQFLLDGTLVIEPAAVDTTTECKDNQESTKEIDFDQFIMEMQTSTPDTNHKSIEDSSAPKKNISSIGLSPNTYGTVKCSACNTKINPFVGPNAFEHPLLEVILCSNCIKNQKEEFFIIDKEDNKETLCRWCVEGGSLICCDFCPKSFCKTCIKRNLGRTILAEILGQDDTVQWKCFACDPKPIEVLKTTCRKVLDDVRIFTDKQQSLKSTKRLISKVAEPITKKRSIAKAFPPESNGSPAVKTARVSTPQSVAKGSPNTEALVSNMANFGTDWYMRNVKLRNIFTEIDEIDSRSLLNVLNSTKKCVEAFYSDIRNLETEISKATTAADIGAVVSMFKSVYRHHIFNRFCQVKARIADDRRTTFVAQPANGAPKNVINTHSVPNLTINNVVSTAHLNRSSSTPRPMNGHISVDLTDSIDLTDDPSPAGLDVLTQVRDDVVDLCADDDVPPAANEDSDNKLSSVVDNPQN